MKILVTGGAGFIGTNLIKRLLIENHHVISIDNYDTGTSDNHLEGVRYIRGDIENIKSLVSGNFDICFHLAALSRIQPSFNNPSETFRVNVKGTESVCEWARTHQVKVIYAGSSSRWHNPYLSPYAMYKHLGEELVKMYKTIYKTNFEIARFYNVYGPHEITDGDWAAVIGKWRGQIKRNSFLTIVGDGEQRRDFTHVDDIVDGLYRIAMTTLSHNDAWELGTGTNYSINEVYHMFNQRFNVPCRYVPDEQGNYRSTQRYNDDTLTLLKWQPTDKLSEYIRNL